MTEELAAEEIDDGFDVEIDDSEDTDDIEEEASDNVGDPSVEINVEELIHDLEADGIINRIDSEKDTRRRLEELMERKRSRRELEDFDDYDI